MKKNVCVDLDSTLLYYSNWEKMGGMLGKPRPGAQDFLKSLQLCCHIIIFTARLCEQHDSYSVRRTIREHLEKHGLVYDELYGGAGKPVCACFVDDKAVEVPRNPVEVDFEAALIKVRRRLEDA